jgi:hypothetical protein
MNAGGYDEKYTTWAPDDKDYEDGSARRWKLTERCSDNVESVKSCSVCRPKITAIFSINTSVRRSNDLAHAKTNEE